MPFQIKDEKIPAGAMWTSDRRLYYDKRGHVVLEGVEAEVLLVGAGGQMPMREAVRLGLVSDEKEAARQPDKEILDREDKGRVMKSRPRRVQRLVPKK